MTSPKASDASHGTAPVAWGPGAGVGDGIATATFPPALNACPNVYGPSTGGSVPCFPLTVTVVLERYQCTLVPAGTDPRHSLVICTWPFPCGKPMPRHLSL